MGNNRKTTARFQEGSGASLGAPELVRLSKRMSELGLASRREADAFIEKGWVLVDGKVAQLGQKVGPGARIELKAQASYSQKQQVTVLLNKPVGYVSGQAEDGYKPAKTLITPENRWAGDDSTLRWSSSQLRSLVPAGRLDIDSVGLLVLTQDGRVAKAIIGENSTIEKSTSCALPMLSPVKHRSLWRKRWRFFVTVYLLTVKRCCLLKLKF